MLAQGTPDAPILICGETGQSGYWSSFILRDIANPASALRNALIADGGGTAAALMIEGSATRQGVQVVGSG